MDNQSYYRSPIDKLVVESGIAASVIARKMQIKYHRMVALRREKNVSEQDIALCKKAIEDILHSGTKFRRGPIELTEKPNSVNFIPDSVTPRAASPESVAYLLGKALSLLKITTDSLQTYVQTMPEEFLEQHKKLIEQCDKLLNV